MHCTSLVWYEQDQSYKALFFGFFTKHSATPSGLVETWITKALTVGPT